MKREYHAVIHVEDFEHLFQHWGSILELHTPQLFTTELHPQHNSQVLNHYIETLLL